MIIIRNKIDLSIYADLTWVFMIFKYVRGYDFKQIFPDDDLLFAENRFEIIIIRKYFYM